MSVREAHLVLGFVRMGRGQFPEAIAQLERALALGEQMDEVQRMSPALWGLAETSLRRGRVDDAIAWCEQGYTASSPAWDAVYLFPWVTVVEKYGWATLADVLTEHGLIGNKALV